MSKNVNHRSVTPFLNAIRTFLRGHGHTNPLRFADCIAARNQPPPNIPGGPYHRTSKIYYHTRDARREVQPPLEIPIGKQITAGSDTAALKPCSPNKIYNPEVDKSLRLRGIPRK